MSDDTEFSLETIYNEHINGCNADKPLRVFAKIFRPGFWIEITGRIESPRATTYFGFTDEGKSWNFSPLGVRWYVVPETITPVKTASNGI